MATHELSYRSRKALSVHLGDAAGSELGNLLQELLERVEQLERTKVDVTPIVPLDLVPTPIDANAPAE